MTTEPKQKILKQFQTPKGEEDFKSWVEGVKRKREELLEKRAMRRQRRQDMAKRRTPASVERMRLISQLARNEKRDDDFGMRDEDWDVYKAINKEGGDSDSEGESEKLLELEQVLRAHDPAFLSENNGTAETPGEAHRLHVGVEMIRAPEILFQPSLLGSHQAGLSDVIGFILKRYDLATSTELCLNVFLTGGPSKLPGLCERVTRDLREIRPFKSEIHVSATPEHSLAAWLGAKKLAQEDMFLKKCVSRADYLEKGGEYLREHVASNLYYPSPASLSIVDSVLPATGNSNEDLEIDIL